MRHSTCTHLMVLLLAGLAGSVAEEAHPQPPPLDQEEYLDAEDWFISGLALNGAGRYQDAALAFARSLDINPESAATWLNLGTAQALSGDFDQAITHLKKSLQLEPKLALGYSNLAEVYFRVEQYREAAEAYQELLELTPGDSNGHYKLGLCWLYLGEPGKAQGEYLALKLLDPDLAGKLIQAINQRGK
ncbi:hypothetical protein GMST_26590 [Geomonas silvestris]|uniref:Uncharacterized protein n=1 Tax=Geomonas silvestris TaxID=2740184 RepID=A0A6V8MK80_9BACT|nr:tetratricopeptide repeat protein [Geomonas silvestris]GFO60334.1 hypothetical protein GMST_26590 [Geomonas silvestris]